MLRAITIDDIDRVCGFAAEVFCSYEPMCKALRPTVAQFVQQFRPVLEACCSSSLSFMLEAEGSIVSISLALLFVQYNAVQITELPVFSPVMAVFDDLKHPCEQDPGAVLNFIWATHSDHMNKGYAKQVIEGTTQAAAAAGCSCLVTDATNVVSQHLLPIFGYKPIKQVCYHDYEPFRSISCTKGVIRAMKPVTHEDDVQQQQQQRDQQQQQQGYAVE